MPGLISTTSTLSCYITGYRKLVERVLSAQACGQAVFRDGRSRLLEATRLVRDRFCEDGSAEAATTRQFLEGLVNNSAVTRLAQN